MTIALLIINIVMTAGTIGAFCIAIKSLRETQKTRRDSFMPLVIPGGIGYEGATIGKQGKISIENCGRGPAWDIAIQYPDGLRYNLTSFLHNEKYNQKDCILPWPDFNKCKPQLTPEIIYHDVFHNELKITFPVTVELVDSHKILGYNQKNGFKLILPD